MLKRLKVKNFQRIEDVDIELEPLTVIIGDNWQGKSALLRGLTALITNKTGEKFIRHGQNSCSVEVETDDGHTIKWSKDRKSGAEYELNGLRLTKLGGSVPPEVAEALGIREVEVDANLSLWPQVHKQGEYGFLVNLSPNAAAKAIARMTRLDVVVKAQQLAKKAEKDITAAQKIEKGILDRVSIELEEFEGLSDYKEWLDMLETLYDELKPMVEKAAKIEKFREQYEAATNASLMLPTDNGFFDSLKILEIALGLYLSIKRVGPDIEFEDFEKFKESVVRLAGIHAHALYHNENDAIVKEAVKLINKFEDEYTEIQTIIQGSTGETCSLCGMVITA